jgi:hypothetical protein
VHAVAVVWAFKQEVRDWGMVRSVFAVEFCAVAQSTLIGFSEERVERLVLTTTKEDVRD